MLKHCEHVHVSCGRPKVSPKPPASRLLQNPNSASRIFLSVTVAPSFARRRYSDELRSQDASI